jgi:hypothetical protein
MSKIVYFNEMIKTKTMKLFTNCYDDLATNTNVTELHQSDFANGTYIVDQPGIYKLAENISFNPNSYEQLKTINNTITPYECGDVLSTQLKSNGGLYDDDAYKLGFFCAISIMSKDVILDLNGFTIEQSMEHYLQQRFFAVIELADQPFIPGAGPHNFGSSIVPAKNCCIINGIIGRSAHHSVHGNNNENIMFHNVEFKGYEVAAISLNNASVVCIKKCNILQNSRDVMVLGIWSSARFIRRYIEFLVENNPTFVLTVQGIDKTVVEIRDELRTAMDNVFFDVVASGIIDEDAHKAEFDLFNNASRLLDGNAYGILLNKKGPAVNGFPDRIDINSRDVYINDVLIKDISICVNEVIGLGSYKDTGTYSRGVQADVVGSVFQMKNKDKDGNYITVSDDDDTLAEYVGNVISNTQAIVAKAIKNNLFDGSDLSVKVCSIHSDTLAWIESSPGTSGAKLDDLLEKPEVNGYRGNCDSMFHVNKGIIGIKLDCVTRAYVSDVNILNISNCGDVGQFYAPMRQTYKHKVGKSHTAATYTGYNGANTRGISVCSTNYCLIEDSSVQNISSNVGYVYGIDIHQQADTVKVSDCRIIDVIAGKDTNLDLYQNNPTHFPIAVGIHVEKNAQTVALDLNKCEGLQSPYQTFDLLQEQKL